jgi:hypothetical protein
MNTPRHLALARHPVSLRLAGAFVLLLLPVVALADDCAYEEVLDISLPADAVVRLDIEAGAGSLQVRGESADGLIHLHGRVCASRKSLLEGVALRHALRDGTQFIETVIPDTQTTFWTSNYRRLDLTVTLPAGLPVAIDDGSGEVRVSGTGALTLEDGSGSTSIDGVQGDVRVRDGSGDLRISQVNGNVEVKDGSGALFIADVQGRVDIRDGSGSIDVQDVTAEVTIHEAGSGSVAVQRVATLTQVAGQ